VKATTKPPVVTTPIRLPPSQFPISAVRYGLVALGGALLVFGAVEILQLPGPPT
jgi:hypothetical protein